MQEHKGTRLSMYEAIDRLQPDQAPRRNDMASELNTPSTEWDLKTDFKKAALLAEFGWREKVSDLEGYLTTVKELVRESWNTHLDVTGESVDIGAYLEGEPECMLNYVVPETKAVRIVANMSARCTADAPRLLNRGIAIAAAVYALQCSGVPVSLAAAEWVSPSRDSDTYTTLVEINPFGDYIDAGRLAFWLGHPAALRRCFFRFQEQESTPIREKFGFYKSSGYGVPVNPQADSPDLVDAIFITFPETSDLHLYQTPAKAFETIREILSKQGVDLAVRT